MRGAKADTVQLQCSGSHRKTYASLNRNHACHRLQPGQTRNILPTGTERIQALLTDFHQLENPTLNICRLKYVFDPKSYIHYVSKETNLYYKGQLITDAARHTCWNVRIPTNFYESSRASKASFRFQFVTNKSVLIRVVNLGNYNEVLSTPR